MAAVELLAGLGVMPPQPQRQSGDGLDPGRRAILAALLVGATGPVRVPHRRDVVPDVGRGDRGALPEPGGCQLAVRAVAAAEVSSAALA